MKRVIGLIAVLMVAMCMAAPISLAAETDAPAVDEGFEIVTSSPEDGAEGVAVDNFSIKIYFSKEMRPKKDNPDRKAIYKSNYSQFKLTDQEGKTVPIKVYYSPKEKGLMLVAADYSDNNKKDVQIQGAAEYTLTIGDKLEAADGTKFNHTQTIKLKTLNQQRSMIVYMVLMVLMMVGMVFFTIRSTKKAEEKKKEEKTTKGSNPYKEAKRTGKSIEEIVARDQKAKDKKARAEAKQREREEAIEAEILEQMRREKNKRVAAPAPIAKAGSEYRHPVQQSAPKKDEPKKSNKGTTNPKNQSGKKKNSGKKKKKK